MTDVKQWVESFLAENGNPLPELQEIKHLVKILKGDLEFGLARELLTKTLSLFPKETWLIQQLALCTYKDEELPPAARFNEALKLLESIGLRSPETNNPETLALGGAVYKRMWEYGGQLEHLYEALDFYRAAHRRNPKVDMGYGGVNAAFLLDLLASRAAAKGQRNGMSANTAVELSEEARALRGKMLKSLLTAVEKDPTLKDQYWFAVTLAEVYFGLQQYTDAEHWLTAAKGCPDLKEWELQTTFRQLVLLARNQGVKMPSDKQEHADWHPAWQALRALMGDATGPALACYRGKVGLALSGGGFRAAFFHLGAMARLAEVDALRNVEVLSTVSGGSILGAQYYLEVQRLLENPAHSGPVSRDDYIALVDRLRKNFLEGVQANLRMLAFEDFGDNIKMLFSKDYSRSHKLGELYESRLYSSVKDGKEQAYRTMETLKIAPAELSHLQLNFKPKFHNWRLSAKVPVLLLNTTSLNSGHNWSFTASWMGEPPGLLGEEIDVNERYRRLFYYQAPEHLRYYRVGHAVAASSCVPGLFEPLVIDGLYSARTVRLVDGGLYDNQGGAGLAQ